MSYRVQRINELIKRELGKIILKEVDLAENVLLTITRVETAANLETTRVYVSAFPEGAIARSLKTLKSQVYFLQQLLNRKLRMRPVPRIFFCEEKTTVVAGRIDELLEKVKQEPIEKNKKNR